MSVILNSKLLTILLSLIWVETQRAKFVNSFSPAISSIALEYQCSGPRRGSFFLPSCRRHDQTAKVSLSATIAPPTEGAMGINETTAFGANEANTDGISDSIPKSEDVLRATTQNVPPRMSKRKDRVLLDLNQALNDLAEKAASSTTSSSAVSAAAQAEKLWKDTINNNNNTDIISFNTVLKAWGKCCHTLEEQHQKGPFIIMQQKQQQRQKDLDQTQPSSTTTAKKWQDRLNEYGIYMATDAASRAENLLHEQIKSSSKALAAASSADEGTPTVAILPSPDTHSFNIVLDAWAKTRDPRASEHTEALFRLMKKNEKTSPDSISYSALVEALAYSNNPQRFNRLDEIWNELQENASQRIKSNVRPSVRIMNSILQAYSRRALDYELNQHLSTESRNDGAHKYAEKASEMLEDMKNRFLQTKDNADHPDVMTYTIVMECWSRCSSHKGVIKAEELFSELKCLCEQRSGSDQHIEPMLRLSPTVHTYTTLIKAWARAAPFLNATAPHRTEELLEELLDASSKQQHLKSSGSSYTLQPNAMPFTALLQCLARSKYVPDKATKALELLKRMKQLAKASNNPAILPTLMTYNAAIDVCARTVENVSPSSEKQNLAALQIAFAVLKAIEKESQLDSNSLISPNHVTYGTLLKAVGMLLPPSDERNKIAKAVFEKAVAAGQVDISVLRGLQKAADVSVVQELLPENSMNHHTDEHDKIESLILQRNPQIAKTSSAKKNMKGKYIINTERIPSAWRMNVRT